MDILLKKKIMRRIYTAYVMRVLCGARARHFFVMVLSVAGLMQYVSVLDVAKNFSHVSVGQAGAFVLGAVTNTEYVTLAVIAVFAYAGYAFWRGDVGMQMATHRA